MGSGKLAALILPIAIAMGTGEESPVIRTTTGLLRGKPLTVLGMEVDAYLGVPYATPPIGDLRFRRPVPIPPWPGVYNATAKPSPCYQIFHKIAYYTARPENRTEDCLYLNIWVRRFPSSGKRRAILVYIHGGAFVSGSSDIEMYDGAALAAYGDVIVASFNYRVGALGFFFANVESAGGNMGLFDQALALKWINDNAENFGGDRNKITLFGESTGASAVAVHLMSPLSQNLFARGILESGTAMHPLTYDAPRSQLKMSNDIARAAKCASYEITIHNAPEQVVQCMRSLPVEEIIAAQKKVQFSRVAAITPIHGDEFLPDDVTNLVRQHPRNKEILVGINNEEGSWFIAEILEDYVGENGHDLVDNVGDSLAKSMVDTFFKLVGVKDHKNVTEFYMKNSNGNLLKPMYDGIGDYLVACGALLFADLYSINKNNTYFYVFNHRPTNTITAEWMGVTHGHELEFVFGRPLMKGSNHTQEERELSMRIMDRWIAFAESGNPNVEGHLKWPHYSHEYPAYICLDMKEAIKMRPNYGRCEVWRKRFRAVIGPVNIRDREKRKQLSK